MRILIVIGVAALVHVVICWRLTTFIASSRVRLAIWIVMTLVFLLVVFRPITWAVRVPFLTPGMSWALGRLSFIAMGLYSFVFTAWVFREVGGMIYRIAQTQAAVPPDQARRDLVGNAMNLGMLGLAGFGASVGFFEARRRARVVGVKVPIKDLPEALEGFRIVQLSDIHVGPTIDKAYLRAIVDKVNELDADLVALTGDIIDAKVSAIQDDVSPLADLKSRHGTYLCTGNHEYYAGASEWVKEFRRLGLKVLLNEGEVIEAKGHRLLLGGVTDTHSERFIPSHRHDPHACCTDSDDCAAKILLAHRPDSVYEAAKAGFDLQLSGHTHGGQFFPWNLVVKLVHEYSAGLAKHEDTWIYVSRGTGYFGPPFRLFAPSEITKLELTRA